MNVKLYKNFSEPERVNKELELIKDMDGSLREESNVLSPVITIQADNPSRCNYAYIDTFGRYYFINEIEAVRTKIWRLHLQVDPLYTYRKQILKHTAVIEKQEGSKYSSELYNDGSYKTREDNFLELWEFPNGFSSSGNFILLTAGALSS